MNVGGEFYYDSRWRLETPALDTSGMLFLNGGKACLILISKYLRAQGINRVLLPAYICPTIINTLEKCGILCGFYRITPQLTIDLDDLVFKAESYEAVYFINYFGFPHSTTEHRLLQELQRSGRLLVEDNAQAGFCGEFIGDFVFNSMRKLCPYDGGYLLTQLDVQPHLAAHNEQPNRRLPLIRDYRLRLTNYLYRGIGDREELQSLYDLAEYYYETDMLITGDAEERWQIEHHDWQGIRQKRRENYLYLLSLLTALPEVKPLYPELPESVMPFGLPVIVSGVSRDWLFEALGKAGIGLTIHWGALLQDPRLNLDTTAAALASTMMTLVIDQRATLKQLDYQWLMLHQSIKEFKARRN